MAQKNILIICGEASGDLHAGNLALALKKINPQINIFGVGGETMRQAGAELFYDIKGLSVMGLFDVLKKLPKFFALKKLILEKIKSIKPDAVILVDFSGFNLRLAKAINNAFTTIYYVSPQVWASRRGRMETIKKYLKKVIVLFKFEEAFYKKYGINVDFSGHPLLDVAKPTIARAELLSRLNLMGTKTTIALLPGSRKQEIKNILPIMLKTARLIGEKIEAQFVIAKSNQVDWDFYNQIIKKVGIEVKMLEGKTYDCINIADFCLVCSGTATLETAIMQKPFVIVYKMNFLNYLLYRPQVKLPYIGMVNIVAGKKIIPEFIQFRTSPKKISAEVLKLLQDPNQLQIMKDGLAKVKSSLGEPGASARAAGIILNFLNK